MLAVRITGNIVLVSGSGVGCGLVITHPRSWCPHRHHRSVYVWASQEFENITPPLPAANDLSGTRSSPFCHHGRSPWIVECKIKVKCDPSDLPRFTPFSFPPMSSTSHPAAEGGSHPGLSPDVASHITSEPTLPGEQNGFSLERTMRETLKRRVPDFLVHP
jgi:hypothetical protein